MTRRLPREEFTAVEKIIMAIIVMLMVFSYWPLLSHELDAILPARDPCQHRLKC